MTPFWTGGVRAAVRCPGSRSTGESCGYARGRVDGPRARGNEVWGLAEADPLRWCRRDLSYDHSGTR